MLMATDTEISHTFTVLEGSYNNKDNTPTSNNELQVKSETSGKPPRHSISSAMLVASSDLDFDYGVKEAQCQCPSKGKPSFIPVYRSGSYAEKGPKQYMEDEHIRIDHLLEHFGETAGFTSSGAFYGVFDGHGGTDAAVFVRNNILKFIVEESCFPLCLEKAISNAFLKTDYAFADDSALDISSGDESDLRKIKMIHTFSTNIRG
nr:probable protein phosphatase 2C 27 [Ipomoea batatas]